MFPQDCLQDPDGGIRLMAVSDEAAKILLQGSVCRSHLAFALASLDGNGEVRQKIAEIFSITRPCGRILASRGFWDSRGESGMIHRTPTESGAGAYVDKDG
jgi:hypothetical protein